MEEIIRALCSLWKPEWQGMVMGELRYRRGADVGGPYRVTASGRRIVRVAADSDGGEHMELLLFPYKETSGKVVPEKGVPWRVFSAEEVRRCSRALGDHNGLHQTDRPVVSGFQIALALSGEAQASSFRLRFHQPIRSGETVYLLREGNRMQGMTDVLCFTYEWEAL